MKRSEENQCIVQAKWPIGGVKEHTALQELRATKFRTTSYTNTKVGKREFLENADLAFGPNPHQSRELA